MTKFVFRPKFQKAAIITAIILALGAGSRGVAQISADAPPVQQSPSVIAPQDLANLVAPVALYPDALLAQVLAASTYPLEVVEAQQWLQQNAALPNRALLQAAQQQSWDPSVQALVAFPGVLALLNRNISWTTDLGNAFLAQQADVMSAIQTLRAQARESGQLASTPQLSVHTEVQGDRSAIEIQPVNPQIIYVPSYNPSFVWGAPVEGSYPDLPYAGSGFGSFFSAIANLAGFLPGFQGLLGLRSWGWALSWLAQALFVNNNFFNDFGFHTSGGGYSNGGYGGGGYGGSSLWVHNAHHRLGVPYGSSTVASRYGEGRGSRPVGDGWRSFGSPRGLSAAAPRQLFAPRPSTASQSFQHDYRPGYRTEGPGNQRTFSSNPRMPSINRTTTGQSARTFSQPPASRPTATTARSFPPNRSIGRDPYLANSAYGRAHPFPAERSFSNPRSSASMHDSFGNFSKAHMSSHNDSPQHGFSQRAPKQPHFSAPKFKAPKFKAPKTPKFHGEGHASRGHSGSRSHRG